MGTIPGLLLAMLVLAACGDAASGHAEPEATAQPEHRSAMSATPTAVAVAGWKEHLVDGEYRSAPVDIGHPRFDYLDTTGSSFVSGAWYDAEEDYMVIRLQATYYHYCGLPSRTWFAFSDASSFGSFYNNTIQGRFDCRDGGVPTYAGS